MAQLKIKFPTLNTGETGSHYASYADMINEVFQKVMDYSSLPADQKHKVSYRGRSQIKVIKNIATSRFQIGEVPAIRLEIEEYKTGLNDMYIENASDQDRHDISQRDKLGTVKNYALMYPIIKREENTYKNIWLVIIYDTPDKNSDDIMNTVKVVVEKILEYPSGYIVPLDYSQNHTYPYVEVTYTTIENNEAQNPVLQDYIISTRVKKIKTEVYENLPKADLPQLFSVQRGIGEIKKRIKVFKDRLNKSKYDKYDLTSENQEGIIRPIVSKYSYSYDLGANENIYDDGFMLNRFIEVVRNFLNNGQRAVNGR